MSFSVHERADYRSQKSGGGKAGGRKEGDPSHLTCSGALSAVGMGTE